MKLTLRITVRYLIAFFFLTNLYMGLHELIHHFVGAAVCGGWGYKTFNYFQTACEPEESQRYIATLAGPAFTFAIMWVGAWVLLKGRTPLQRHWGFAVIFAQLPMQRMHGPIGGFNDEWYAVSNLWGSSELNQWLTIGVVWALAVPPLIIAFRAIENRRRILWFALYFLLLPYVVWGPVFFGLEFLLVEHGVLAQTVIGIAWLFLITEVITTVGHVMTHRWLDPQPPAAGPAGA